MVGPVGDIPVEAMARFTAAEARLYPMVMTDAAGYRLATSLVGLIANELRRDCADIAEVLARRAELIGRLPVISALNQLSVADLARILTEPKDALIKQYQVLFLYDDAKLNFTDAAILEIARMAKARGTGARALRSILENLMLDIMFDLPEHPGAQTYLITDRVVRGEESVISQAAA